MLRACLVGGAPCLSATIETLANLTNNRTSYKQHCSKLGWFYVHKMADTSAEGATLQRK